MNPGYTFNNATTWINPENHKFYDSQNIIKWHQMYFQLPVEGESDPYYVIVSDFLRKFYFKQMSVLISGVRKSINPGPAKFLDLVIFQGEASHAQSFDTYA